MSAGPLRNPDLASRKIQGRFYLVEPKEGTLHQLNEVATRVWELMDGERSLAEIAGIVTEEFEVEQEQAERDVLAFVSSLVERGLARSRDEGQ